jgi:hypothetical protein
MAVAPKKVFLDYTQEGLDRAYDQRTWARNAEALIALCPMVSAETRKRLRFTSHDYAASGDETLGVFPAGAANAPVAIFRRRGTCAFGRALRRPQPRQHSRSADSRYGGEDPPRRRLDLQQCGELWRRSGAAARARPIVGRPSVQRDAHDGLDQVLRARAPVQEW